MADNTTLSFMTGGDVIATDDIGSGVKVQRVKVGHGSDGSYADVSAAAPLPVSLGSGASVGSNVATVATPGTRVQLGAVSNVVGVTVRAKSSNADVCYVGGSNVSASNGYELEPGEAISLDVTNPNAIYVDAAHAGDGITYLWVVQ